jgi:type I restriction enzyme M protein
MAAKNTDTKKEHERAKLHSTIWKIANDLRGSVDGWDFKQYVLGMLLYRFISENLTNYINSEELRDASTPRDFNFASLSDDAAEFGRTETVKEKGFFILPSELFENVRKRAKNDDNLNETLSGIFRNIENSAKGAESEDDIKGLFDDIDVNSNKLGSSVEKRNRQLVKLLDAVGDLQLGSYQDNTIDAFGDAYEFLMGMYASNAGKSGGEYYTPQEVSELLARITIVGNKEVNKVYDPAVGSGSLLLQFAKILGKENVRQGFFGQEINITTYNLCRINMILHDINYEKFSIHHGDTLTDPSPEHWDEEPFEAIVSNPPYSINWAGDSDPLLINDPRFSPAGVLAPKSKADLAFTMHMLSWLSTTGTAAIVEFPGVLYRGAAEQKIRKYLIDNNFVDAVIQLPPDLFFGTTIATCILVLKKSKNDNATLFIDASAEFVRGGNKNKLSEENRSKILESYANRQDIDHFAKLVQNSEIADNDYNIAVSSYVEEEDTSETVDIKALNQRIDEIITKQSTLRSSIDAIVNDLEDVNE